MTAQKWHSKWQLLSHTKRVCVRQSLFSSNRSASLSVFVPDDNTGDMMGELNKRRGRVLGMNPAEKKGMTEIVAEVPMAEMADFTLLLRQMTQGQGVFTFEKARYEPLPANLVADVIAKNAVAD